MKFVDAQKPAAQAAALAIVAAAVVLTYTGTAQFCHHHGAPGWRGYTIAAMNDAAVLVGIVWPARQLQALALACAGFTGWANYAHAAPGPAGAVVALVPPVLAVLMIAALESVVRSTRTVDIGQGTSAAGQDTRVDTEGDSGQDTRGDTGGDSEGTADRTPEGTVEGTPGGQDTGQEPDTREDTGPDTEGDTEPDIVSPPKVDNPQVAARKTPDTRPAAQETTVVPFTGQRARVVAAVIAGRMTQKDAAAKLGCSTKTIGRYVVAARPGSRDEATG